MRIAGTVAWLGALSVGAAVLVGGWAMMSRVRRDQLPPELRLPLTAPEPRAREPLLGPPHAHERSSELPPWFGDAAAAPVRIAGAIIGAQYPTLVRLAIDVPEPAIWSGREILVGPDGAFDFGPMRRGKYLVVASGVLRGSRITRVDTTEGPVEHAELFVYPCKQFHDELWMNAKRRLGPAVGVAIAIAGRVVATTDAHGRVDVCAQEQDDLQIQEVGYVRSGWFPYPDFDGHRMLWPEYLSTGTVLEASGSPAAHVGVQPIWFAPTDVDGCQDGAVVVTTDDDGRFEVAGHSRMCGLRVFRGTATYEVVNPEMRDHWRDNPQVLEYLPFHGGALEMVVRLPRRDHAADDARSSAPGAAVGAWIRGHVVRGGAPVADARVALLVDTYPTRHGNRTYTHRDGSFALAVERQDVELRSSYVVDTDTRGLAGRVSLAPGAGLYDVTIELGAGLLVRGAVVDTHGRPVAGVRVALDENASHETVPTDRDGRYALTLPCQGRYRLRVFDQHGRELSPPPGRLPPAVDVVHPDGERSDAGVVVQRDVPAGRFSYDTVAGPEVDLGVLLDDAGIVVRVDDEARLAGMRVGDRVVSIGDQAASTRDLIEGGGVRGDDPQAGFAFFVRPGEDVHWTVARAGKTLAFQARAPLFGSPPRP